MHKYHNVLRHVTSCSPVGLYLMSTRATRLPPTKKTSQYFKPYLFSSRGPISRYKYDTRTDTKLHGPKQGALLHFQERELVLHPAVSDEILAFTDTR